MTQKSDQTNAEADSQPVSPMEFITTSTGDELYLAGPLAQAYSQGLNELYAKQKTENGMALESQAVDLGLQQRSYLLAKTTLLDTYSKTNMSLFYGVQKGAVYLKNVVDVVDALASMQSRQRKRSAVVIDAMIRPRGGNAGIVEYGVALEEMDYVRSAPLESALESWCHKHGVAVYESFEEFLQKHS